MKLSKDAQKWVGTLREEYAIQDAEGLALLQLAGECLMRLWAAQEAVNSGGLIVTDRYGSPKPHPALQLEKESRSHILQCLKQLSLAGDEVTAQLGRPPGIRS